MVDKTKGQNRKYRVGNREGGGKERNGTWKRKQKAESVLNDKQETPSWSQVKIERMLPDPEIPSESILRKKHKSQPGAF